jgi:hypothetical protein
LVLPAVPPIGLSDHNRGLPATEESPFTVYAAAMMCRSKVSKNRSPRHHIGYKPPPSATGTTAPPSTEILFIL